MKVRPKVCVTSSSLLSLQNFQVILIFSPVSLISSPHTPLTLSNSTLSPSITLSGGSGRPTYVWWWAAAFGGRVTAGGSWPGDGSNVGRRESKVARSGGGGRPHTDLMTATIPCPNPCRFVGNGDGLTTTTD